MATAVYPGTFDPLTGGHEDLVRRASSLFDRVVIGVAHSRGKSPLFEPEERLAVAREVLEPLGNVEVVSFSGLMVDFARKHGATVVVRGLRSVTDFDYEFQLAGMNRHLMPELETVFLIPGERYQFVSATLVREIAIMGGEVGQFVSSKVEARLREKVASLKRG
ncbi:pantetheine-phosphate adenylyltransferase [Quisquiliibacterium transsilvanicum]|uniref:Phosphopantetheine adenylyltransferase n=1 Tax=Quisquiliibacterium transsilvanicum TaxID=1549638 RepID=A0A7W8HJB3_9BURK|nr:pantetheine-phosphate adenylyltransferase [Quisquiliibacterium transsilvanicum]MBB5273139.1 pantetheine-phosphate adenylyltransferase [Quisquiliibacterium transsilvanicum]